MKRIIWIGALAVFLVGVAGGERVKAVLGPEDAMAPEMEGNGGTSVPVKVKQANEIQEQAGVGQGTLDARREEVRARFTEVRQARVRQFWGLMQRRLEAAISRLERLGERISSRLTKMAAAGEDVSDLQAKLTEAQAKLATAKSLVGQLEAEVEGVIVADEPRTAFEKVREMVKQVVGLLKEVHRAYVEIVGEMRGLRVGPAGSAGEPTDSVVTVTPEAEE